MTSTMLATFFSLTKHICRMTLRERLRHDVSVKVASKTGHFRFCAVHCGRTVEELFRRHELIRKTQQHKDFLELTGQCVGFCCSLASFLQFEERVLLRFVAPEAVVHIESIALGEVRGYVRNKGECDSDGSLNISRILCNKAHPVTSVTHADAADLSHRLGVQELGHLMAHDLSLHALNFMMKSEGAEHAALLVETGIDMEDCTAVAIAGIAQPIAPPVEAEGLLVPLRTALLNPEVRRTTRLAMLDATNRGFGAQYLLSLFSGDYVGAEATAVAARQLVDEIAACRECIEPMREMMGITSTTIPLDPETTERTRLDFFCRCSAADVIARLTSWPKEDLLSSFGEDGTLESRCAMCAKTYTFTRSQLGV